MPILATELASEILAAGAAVHPVSSSTALSTGWVDCSQYARMAAILSTGLIAATGTFNAKLEQANTAGGGGVKDITGKAITALTDTGDNTLHIINVRADELDLANGFRWVRLTLTPATAASLLFGILLGLGTRGLPVAQSGWTQVIN